jgi:hypothetical protein
VPYILCIPYSYKHYNYNRTNPEAGTKTVCVWAWPTEFTTICNADGTSGPYRDFAGWVQNKNNNTDWYKNKDYQRADAATVDNLFLGVSSMNQAEINGNSANENSGDGGNNSATQTYTVSGSYEECSFIIEASNGKYNVKYDGTPILTGITELTFNVVTTGNFWIRSSDYQGYNGEQKQNGFSGSIKLNSSDLAAAAAHSPLLASNNGYGVITSLTLEGK